MYWHPGYAKNIRKTNQWKILAKTSYKRYSSRNFFLLKVHSGIRRQRGAYQVETQIRAAHATLV
jgi:hypothetical protein